MPTILKTVNHIVKGSAYRKLADPNQHAAFVALTRKKCINREIEDMLCILGLELKDTGEVFEENETYTKE